MKKIYCVLLIISVLLLGLCGYNYSEYKKAVKNNNSISDNISNTKNEIKKLNDEKEELNKKYEETKEKNKDKLLEYEKWQKMTKEIEEKMQ